MAAGQGEEPVASPPTGRVLDLIEALADDPGEARSLTGLARETGMTRATAHAILATLTARGWALRHADKTYAIGPALATLGREVADHHPLERLAHDAIAKLAVEQGHLAVVVHRAGSQLLVSDVAAPPGRRAPIDAGARIPYLPPFGPAFAAWDTAAERERWLAHAARINPALGARLEAVLTEIRARGFSLERHDDVSSTAFDVLGRLQDDAFGDAVRAVIGQLLADLSTVDYLPGELDRGGRHRVTSIAAPVLDAEGTAILNLALQPRGALSGAELLGLGTALADVAAGLSASLPDGAAQGSAR